MVLRAAGIEPGAPAKHRPVSERLPEVTSAKATGGSGNRLAHHLRRFRRKVSEAGLLFTVDMLAHMILPQWVFFLRVYDVGVIDLRLHLAGPDGDPLMRWLDRSDIDRRFGTEKERDFARKREARGEWLCALDDAGTFMALIWFAPNSYRLTDWIELRLAPDEMISCLSWVPSRFRRRGLYPRLAEMAHADLARRGYRKLVGFRHVLNKPSDRAQASVGYISLGHYLLVLRLFGFALVRYRSHWKLGFSSKRKPLALDSGLFAED